MEKKFADSQDNLNDSPFIDEIYDFLTAHPGFTAHGYAVDVSRDDYQVSIEGVLGNTRDKDAIIDFIGTFRFADEFTCYDNFQYCQYDKNLDFKPTLL